MAVARQYEILVADDDLGVRRSLQKALEVEGYRVRLARNGDEALAAIAERRPDLVLLDVDMPVRGGFSTCAEIRRADPLLPVVFLTAMAAEEDQVRGFGEGGDDYILKGQSSYLKVTLASVRRQLRRSEAIADDAGLPETLRLGRLTVDFGRHRVYDGDGEIAHLTASETDILRILAARRGEGLAIAEIIAALHGADYALDPATIRTHVCHLRQKLGPAAELLMRERGGGYCLLK